ncbi:GNAT family protein [uncultured Sphaerochaeta sp.]|uniref:GNAT family N-acetyltransferase n=1 Tax=uncultured Sphaerochaeta sp. TaxID=886478 RepID=UPI002A0A2D6D|nr:GNAT family protein [uncultured Sphaerochaeta sp.]
MEIQLVPFTPQDFDELIGWSGEAPFLMQWAGPMFHYPLTAEQLFAYNQDANNEQTSDKLNYRVLLASTNQGIGHVSIGSIDRDNGSARVTKVIVGESGFRGKGAGKAIVEAVLAICFGKLGLHRVTLGVFDFNIPALATYKHAGFTIDGILRDARKMGETYWNLVEMSILEDEWRAIQKIGNQE